MYVYNTATCCGTANLHTKILGFGGLDSRRILILRGGILMPTGDIPEIASQQILAGTILAGILIGRRRMNVLKPAATPFRRPIAPTSHAPGRLTHLSGGTEHATSANVPLLHLQSSEGQLTSREIEPERRSFCGRRSCTFTEVACSVP